MSTESRPGEVGGNVCATCGAMVPATAPGGMCAKCLLEGAAVPTETVEGGPPGRPGVPDLRRLAEAFPELEIAGWVGLGGMGAVFKARQPHLDRWVAVKVLSEALAANPAFAERFNREARTLARLNHPNIVTVHDFGRRGEFYFLLMEYVDGVNLRQAMKAGRFTAAQALGLVPKICEALQFAHEEGVLHRDIKPENILLDARGRVKIADFGIAKLMGDGSSDRSLTVSGATLGTPAYMAPEQIENPTEVDHRADIYSLGVVLYELLTGELPLGRFPPPSERGGVDDRVDAIVMRALEKERELRQQSAAQVRTEVEGVTGPVAGGAAVGSVEPAGAGKGMLQQGTGPEPDFVLCNPRLPRMAQWITVYALLVMPVLWLMNLASFGDLKDPSPYAQFVQAVQNTVGIVGELAVVVMLGAGGWKLRALRVSGPRLIRAGIWTHLFLCGVVVALAMWHEALRKAPSGDIQPGEMLLACAGLAGLAFEISALIWLRRHSHRLARIFAASAPQSEDAMAEVAMTAPTDGVARHATVGAALTAVSVVLGLVALGFGVLVAELWVRRGGNPWSGSGAGLAEWVPALLYLLLVGGSGVVGSALGWSALLEIRESQKRLGGVGRGLFAGLAWPLMLVEMAILTGLGWLLSREDGGFWWMSLIALAGALALAEVMVRSAWRWVRKIPRDARLGRLPGSGRGLVIGSLMVALVATACLVGWIHHLRSGSHVFEGARAGRGLDWEQTAASAAAPGASQHDE